MALPSISEPLPSQDKQLTMNFSAGDDFIFQGLDGEECEDFVFWINWRGKEEGKESDDQWMAKLAMHYMAKGALRWYTVQLEPEVQESWKLLRKALMDHYPAPEQREPQPRRLAM